MRFDIQGRIRNMRLPDGKTACLYSIYEAVMNGIQAIEERFGADNVATHGVVSIDIAVHSDKNLQSISVRDNGIGLNDRHLDSFDTCDTTEKAAIGGRGVGRLVWIKAFAEVIVKSTYEKTPGNFEGIDFHFVPEEGDSRVGLVRNPSKELDIGTTISLRGVRDTDTKISPSLLARSLCHHFFPFFIAGSMPTLKIQMAKHHVDVGNYLSTRMSAECSEEVDVPGEIGKLQITHVYVDTKIARELSNSILLTAQGRVVESVEIERKFALRALENKKAYACVVRGSFLDDKVDQERTSFKARAEDMERIKDASLSAAERFLSDHIRSIKCVQKISVVNLLEEHPQLAASVADVDNYVDKLSPSMSDEDIAKTLFTLLIRREKGVRAQIHKMNEASSGAQWATSNVVEELVQKVSDDAKRRLAEYTIKRHQIIQIARSMLRYANQTDKIHELEKTIHNFICPMGRMISSKNYSDHNLWLVDDLLSYYQLFASDKTLSALGIEGERKEPDLIFFNPFGFRREGTNDPVVIIEFKRPGDENLSSDPIDQVLGYIEKLRQKTIKDMDGAVVSDINQTTPFECIVICDLTEGARRKFERSVAQNPTPDGMGYYGFSPRHNASMRVISYQKLFRDAEIRNQSFFEHLGLLPQQVSAAIAASMRVA